MVNVIEPAERFYAYTAENCPTKHYNPGDDICEDCGTDLNPPGPAPVIYDEAEQTISAASGAARMFSASRLLAQAVEDMLEAYRLRPALNDEQPAGMATCIPASLDEWFPEVLALRDAWKETEAEAIKAAEEAAAQLKAETDPEPETRRVVVLSTAHLTPETLAYLNATPSKDWRFSGGMIDFGFYLYAHDDPDAMAGCPADLFPIWAWARGRGFDYIQMDCDAEVRPDLPAFDH